MSRDENRARFPDTAMFLEELRKYAPNAKVVYVREGNHEAGDRARYDEWDRGVVPVMRVADEPELQRARKRMVGDAPSDDQAIAQMQQRVTRGRTRRKAA